MSDGRTPSVAELVREACRAFTEQFEGIPTVGAYAPGRVNLIGEHTDYTDGLVLPMAIQMVTVVVGKAAADTSLCRCLTLADKADDPKLVTFPAKKEQVTASSTPRWANYIKGTVACYKGEVPAFDAVVVSSVPFGKGLSSSASMQVALYTFMDGLATRWRDESPSKKDKTLACLEGEHLYAGLPGGIMDQYISFMAHKGTALFIDCRTLEGRHISLDDPTVSVLVCDSNVQHELTESEYTPRQQQCVQAAAILGLESLRDATTAQIEARKADLGDELFRRVRHIISENQRTEEAAMALEAADYSGFGDLMLQSHQSLRDDFEVSCPELDQLVVVTMEVEGVYGARMTGGGFGGCTVTLVKTGQLQAAMDHIKKRFTGEVTFYCCTASEGADLVAIPYLIPP